MVRSLSLLAMAGAAAAYNSNPRAVVTPVPPPFTTTPIPPVTTPVYSSTVTRMTTYYPSTTDDYGAISTHKVTSTRHFDPSTYNPGPTDACYGGVIIFSTEGQITTPLNVGLIMAQIAAVSNVDWKDFTVYEAKFNAASLQTQITTLICNMGVFDKVVKSMKTVPAEWYMVTKAEFNHVVHPNAISEDIYISCGTNFNTKTDSTFLFNGKCVPCTPLPPQKACAIGQKLACTNPADSHCVPK